MLTHEYTPLSEDEYLQEQAHVEIHRRRGDVGWERIEYSGIERVQFASVELTVDMRDIYEEVALEPRDPDEDAAR